MIYSNLKKARKINNLTCVDMAKFLSVSSSYYNQIENGRRKLDYEMAVKISAVFGLQPDDIFYRYYKNMILKKTKQKDLKVVSYF